MALKSFYEKRNQKTTVLSGGRKHYSYREPVIVPETSTKILMFGENPYTISMDIFATDEKYYFITDVNKPKDAMSWEVGEEIQVPEAVVVNSYDKPNIF